MSLSRNDFLTKALEILTAVPSNDSRTNVATAHHSAPLAVGYGHRAIVRELPVRTSPR